MDLGELGDMSDLGPEDVEGDPWLTVAEIGEELRVNPATVRLWISKGALPATRAGQRKLLIRRSDLEYMLDVIRREPPARGYQPRPRNPQGGMGRPSRSTSSPRLTSTAVGQRRTRCRRSSKSWTWPTMSGSARWQRARLVLARDRERTDPMGKPRIGWGVLARVLG